MENKEKPKVLIDLDKYQELLEKANLNDKTIKEYKDASYNAGYKKGYMKGNDLCQLTVRQACSRLQKTLDDFFENVSGCSMLGFLRFRVDSFFREKIKSYVTESFYSLLEGRWTDKSQSGEINCKVGQWNGRTYILPSD